MQEFGAYDRQDNQVGWIRLANAPSHVLVPAAEKDGPDVGVDEIPVHQRMGPSASSGASSGSSGSPSQHPNNDATAWWKACPSDGSSGGTISLFSTSADVAAAGPTSKALRTDCPRRAAPSGMIALPSPLTFASSVD